MQLIRKLLFMVLIAMVFSVYNSVFAKDDDQVDIYFNATGGTHKVSIWGM